MDKKLTRKASPVSFDLGDQETRDQRMKRLEALARRFNTTPSILLQKIADGEILLVDGDLQGTPGDMLLEYADTFDFAPGGLEEMQSAIDHARASQLGEQ